MSKKTYAESLESTTDDEENRLDHLSFQASLSKINFIPKNDNIPPEDIADVAFARLFNEDFESTTGRIYPKTPIIQSRVKQQPQSFPTSASIGHGTPKCRHKSPANRPHVLHPPLSVDGILNRNTSDSVRKTKSTALPAIINPLWPRNASASTPELKVDDQGVAIEFLSSNDGRESSRKVYFNRPTCYYNFRLIYILLNCFILIIGFVYLGAAIVLCVHKELILVIIDYRVQVSSIICLFGMALFLLAIVISGLCLVRSEPQKTAALQHAACCLVMGAILVVLAFLQSAVQFSVERDAEFRMLSTIQPEITTMNIWDSLHHTFNCCGVRGYLDWCKKLDANSKIYTSADDFLGSFTCSLPESCCLHDELVFGVLEITGKTSCVVAPTPTNTHKSGCLSIMLDVISYLGKMYRIANFMTAFILLLSTTTMILFTYL